jgi:16S rRNA (guanine527-N7)-methyltransferase
MTKEIEQKLRLFVEMVLRYGKSFTSHDTFEELWVLSVLDSVIGWQHVKGACENESCLAVTDIGSGAGFPAIVVSILEPSITVRAIEKKKKAVIFMEMVKDRLKLKNFFPVCSDITNEMITEGIVTSRAVAPLDNFLDLVDRSVYVPMYLWKGPNWRSEFKKYRDVWYPFHEAEYELVFSGEKRKRMVVGLKRYETDTQNKDK